MKLQLLSEHINEIKNRVVYCLIFFVIVFGFAYCFSQEITSFLLNPLAKTSKEGLKVIYTGLGEAFFTYIGVSLYSAFFVSMPFFLLQMYRFTSPGLYHNEKKMLKPLIVSASILFYAGICFAYFFVFPLAWEFFASFQYANINLSLLLETRISEYVDFAFKIMLAFGMAFELPVLLIILLMLDLISLEALRSRRRHAIVIMFVVAAIVTPPDIISQICLALPLILLYEISIIIGNKIIKSRPQNA